MEAKPSDGLYEIIELLNITQGVGPLMGFPDLILERAQFIEYGIDLTPAINYFSGQLPEDTDDAARTHLKFDPLVDVSKKYFGLKGYDAERINNIVPIVKAKPKRSTIQSILLQKPEGQTIYVDLLEPKTIRIYFPDIGAEILAEKPGCVSPDMPKESIFDGLDSRTASLIVHYGRFLSLILEKVGEVPKATPGMTANKAYPYSSLFPQIEAI